MVRILFVCLGNICRSPTAEGVMRAVVEEAGHSDRLEIESAGTGSWHLGAAPDERATAAAARRGIVLSGAARRVEQADLDRYDYVVAMDRENLSVLRGMAVHQAHQDKLVLLREFDQQALLAGELEVPDPYFGGDQGFELVLDVVERGCRGLLERIADEHL